MRGLRSRSTGFRESLRLSVAPPNRDGKRAASAVISFASSRLRGYSFTPISSEGSMKATAVFLVATFLLSYGPARAADWKPAEGPLKTRWAKDVDPNNPRGEYPRPQMVRKQWKSLNGLWEFAKAEAGQDAAPQNLGEQILVPFPVESALSGIMRHEERMWYRRTFDVPKEWSGKHVLLHFDAVDWEATVYLNGKKLGTHRGGYDAFGFDITGFLSK